MWFILLLTFVNALAHNEGFALRYRVEMGGIPIGVFDVLLGLGVVVGLLGRGGAWPTGRAHPLVVWILVLFGVGALGGVIGGVISNAELRWILTGLRNWVSLGTSVLIGYCLMLHPKSAQRLAYIYAFAGVGTAAVILLFFHSKATAAGADRSLASLRAISYVQVYAGIAGGLLLFTIIAKIRMLPMWLTVGMCGFCFVGLFATLSRSDWLGAIASVTGMYLLLPTFRPGGKIVAAIVGPPIVVVFLWLGLIFASTVVGKDFEAQMAQRLYSMLPGTSTPGVKYKAWESRLDAIQKELKIWQKNPVIGGGFGSTEIMMVRYGDIAGLGFRHNSYSNTLAQTGIIGFAGVILLVFGTIIVGRRLARDGMHTSYVLLGALAVIAGTFYLFHGMATQSFNNMRWGIPLGIVAGAALRARALQLAEMHAAYAAGDGYGAGYVDEHGQGYGPDAYGDGYGEHPAPAGAYPAEGYY